MELERILSRWSKSLFSGLKDNRLCHTHNFGLRAKIHMLGCPPGWVGLIKTPKSKSPLKILCSVLANLIDHFSLTKKDTTMPRPILPGSGPTEWQATAIEILLLVHKFSNTDVIHAYSYLTSLFNRTKISRLLVNSCAHVFHFNIYYCMTWYFWTVS